MEWNNEVKMSEKVTKENKEKDGLDNQNENE